MLIGSHKKKDVSQEKKAKGQHENHCGVIMQFETTVRSHDRSEYCLFVNFKIFL
jgi:hypothetical protein